MKDKRGIKRPRSPMKEGSSSPNGGSTPSPAPSGSPSPLGSPLEVYSCCYCSPVLEQGGPSKKILVVNLSSSSDEENPIPNTSWDAEFVKRLFDDLNYGLFGPPDDGKVIILSDSDKEEEEEEVREEDVANTEVMLSFTVKSPTPTTSVVDADDADKGHSPNRAIGDSSSDGNEVGLP
jgi:hypothetical protein